MNELTNIFNSDKSFVTESGCTVKNPKIAYRSWGTLNENRSNVVVVNHALTGNADADEWFSGLFGTGKALDPSRHFIICMNVPGSCYGSTGPWSKRADTQQPWKADFPSLTIRDLVRFQQLLLDGWNITGIEFVIGGSMGGMQALEFAIMDNRVRKVIPIAIGKAHTPWAIGISHTQRQAIFRDPKWQDGYYEQGDGPENGLAIARMIAMVSYRSPDDYQQKFGRSLQPDSPQFQIESYLNYQGDKLVKRFDALSYVRLSEAMDTHDLSRGRDSFNKVLNRVQQPALVIGIDSDKLYPVEEQKELAELLGNSQYEELQSPHGHDAFLIEFEQLNECIVPFIEQGNPSSVVSGSPEDRSAEFG